jgi:hypothetical protein
MSVFYTYNQASADHGPFTLDELRTQVTSGQIPFDKLTRTADSNDWKTASHFLPDLADLSHAKLVSANTAALAAAGRTTGTLASLGLRVCAWLYLAASLIVAIGLIIDNSPPIGIGVIFQGCAAFFFFLVVAEISDNVRTIVQNDRNG